METVEPSRQILSPQDMEEKPDRPYALGIKVQTGQLVFVAGQTSRNEAGERVGVGNISAQTRQAMENIGKILREAGATFDDVVKVTMYLTDLGQLPAAIEARSEFLKQPNYVSTAMQVGLGKDVLVEIDVVAAL